MATRKRKNSPYLYCVFTLLKFKVDESTGFLDTPDGWIKAAEYEVQRRLEVRALVEAGETASKSIRLQEAFEDYYDRKSSTNEDDADCWSTNMAKSERLSFNRLTGSIKKRGTNDNWTAFPEFRLHKITSKHLADHKKNRRAQGTSPAALNAEFGTLKRVLNHARKVLERKARRVDSLTWPTIKLKNGRMRQITKTEIDSIKAELQNVPNGQEHVDFINVALLIGSRHGDICRIAWNDVDFDSGNLVIYNKKTSKTILKPLSGKLLDIMLDRLEKRTQSEWVFPLLGKARNESSAGHRNTSLKWWRQACDRAGVNDEAVLNTKLGNNEILTFHHIRHMYGFTISNQMGPDGERLLSDQDVMTQMGHDDIRSTYRYTSSNINSKAGVTASIMDGIV